LKLTAVTEVADTFWNFFLGIVQSVAIIEVHNEIVKGQLIFHYRFLFHVIFNKIRNLKQMNLFHENTYILQNFVYDLKKLIKITKFYT
jgi:hypothetical protein